MEFLQQIELKLHVTPSSVHSLALYRIYNRPQSLRKEKHLFSTYLGTFYYNNTGDQIKYVCRKRLQKEYNTTNNTQINVFIKAIQHNSRTGEIHLNNRNQTKQVHCQSFEQPDELNWFRALQHFFLSPLLKKARDTMFFDSF